MNNEKKSPVRQIKFRGLRVDGKGWVYGDYFNTSKSSICKFLPTIIENGGMNPIDFHLVKPDSIGQFSGLLDKNGKEIYEGDRVKHGNNIFIVRHSNNRHVLVLKKENDTGMSWRDLEWLGRLKKYITVENSIHEGKETKGNG